MSLHAPRKAIISEIAKLCSFGRQILTTNISISFSNLRRLSQVMEVSIEKSIMKKLSEQLNTTHLEVINESYMHNVPKGAETHFKVLIVTEKFTNLPLIQRHRLVNDLLKDELNNGVHALSIIAKTPDQWTPEEKIEPSPNCKGGFGK